jgi:hypothetical protein
MKYIILSFLFCLTLQAQYYEEPNINGFGISPDKVQNGKEISAELINYLQAKSIDEVDFKQAEKIIAVARFLDKKSKQALITNANLKHNLPTKKGIVYPKVKLTEVLKVYISTLSKSNEKSQVAVAAYLNDILTSVTGKNQSPTLFLKISKFDIKLAWPQIITNYIPTKTHSTQKTSAGKIAYISREVHPDYASKAKEVFNRQATINGLMVTSNAQGVNAGITSEVIGTVTPGTGKASFSFKRKVGSSMEQSLIDAEKALKIRYPVLKEGQQINVSFSNKFVNKDGDSAGTAITVMLLALFEGIDIDKSVAITGTISPSWKVGIVGGVASKIRGALKSNCKIVGIPFSNNSAAQDMAILYGIENLWKIQIFSLSKLEQAIDLARKDKSKNLNRAILLFKDATKYIPRKLYFTKADNKNKLIAKLKEVLRLAPHHLSARILVKVLSGQSFIRISFLTSVEEVNRLSTEILNDATIPDATIKATLKTLQKYAKRVNVRVQPFASQIDTFLKGYMELKTMVEKLKAKSAKGIRDERLYNSILAKQTDVTADRTRLIELGKRIDKDVKAYFKLMKSKK